MSEIERLKDIVVKLRSEDGCAWDKVQTHSSLKPTCIEEAAEVICGINILRETGDPRNLREELGDLLLQVVMHAQIAEEEGLFTMEDVCRGISEKLIRRHPHVFGDRKADDPDSALAAWEDIKKQEKKGKDEVLRYLPHAFDESIELIETARRRKGL